MIKYKLEDLAKDLNMQAKDIAEMIKERFKTVKKPSTLLTDEELNYIFEKVTSEKSVSSFDKYFASKQKASAPKQEKAEKNDKKDKTEKQDKKDKFEKSDRKDKSDRKEKFEKRFDKKDKSEKQDKKEKFAKQDKKSEQKADKKPKIQDKKPVQTVQPVQKSVESDSVNETTVSFERRNRVVDTRQSSVDIER